MQTSINNSSGEYKEIKYNNGILYKGMVINGNIKQGQGMQVWPDGTKYEGLWKNNKANGKGILWHNNGDKY